MAKKNEKKNVLEKELQSRSAFFAGFSCKKKGFTIFELTIVLAIMGIGASIMLVSLSPGKLQAKLRAAQNEVASTIKQTQSYALQGKTIGTPTLLTPSKYGFRSTSTTAYEIFYCLDTSCLIKTKLEEFSLANSGVSIEAGKEVIFDVPNGNSNLSGFDLVITLTSSGKTKTVTVKPGGSVVEN